MAGYEGSKHFPFCGKQVSDQHGANQRAGGRAMMGGKEGRVAARDERGNPRRLLSNFTSWTLTPFDLAQRKHRRRSLSSVSGAVRGRGGRCQRTLDGYPGLRHCPSLKQTRHCLAGPDLRE